MKTLKQLKENLKEIKFYIYKNVKICIYPNPDEEEETACFEDELFFYDDTKYDNHQVRQISVFHLEHETCIDIMLK